MKVMSIITAPNSLSYILLYGVAALRWAEAPGRSGFVPQPGHKEFLLTAYFVMPVIRHSVRCSLYSDRAVVCLKCYNYLLMFSLFVLSFLLRLFLCWGGPALAPAAWGECKSRDEIGP